MPKKNISAKIKGTINGAGKILEQKIVNTLTENYMPYAMSVILSRAIPEIDGFKPSHRKLLYTMYKMGLMSQNRTKSANIVGQTMKLNPHGDSAIYETMVRLSRGNEALLHPFVDSKGNFGKFYSRDMAYAASRYTEAKLDEICEFVFSDIDKNTVDFVENYDNTQKEPTLLPVAFPSILVNANTGIAVGMASSIAPFNLKEVCLTTINLLKNPDFEVEKTLLSPDFPGGGLLIYEKEKISNIYKTGRGSFRIRSKYIYDKNAHCIDIVNIPPTTSIEAIIEKIIDLVKDGKIKEISDIRDETGIDGLKITIDLKRNVDYEKLMQKLFKLTPLEDSFSCNFNILVNGTPKVLGVKQILQEWLFFRTKCIRRRTEFDLLKKQQSLHLLKGLKKILLDIDKAIEIIRKTEQESQVIENLISGFNIDKIQADFVAEIKLRNLNKEYLLRKIKDVQNLTEEIKNLQEILEDNEKINQIIKNELEKIAKKYAIPRKTILIYKEDLTEFDQPEPIEDFEVNVFFTKDGYFKKILPQSLRMNSEQKLKPEDKIILETKTNNLAELLFFTNKAQVFKDKISEFSEIKSSLFGEYIPARLSLNADENLLKMFITTDYSGFLLFFFQDGKVAKVTLKSYQTKNNRKKLLNAYSQKSKLVDIFFAKNDEEFLLETSNGKKLIINAAMLASKSTKDTIGVQVIKLNKACSLKKVLQYNKENVLENANKLYAKKIPSSGFINLKPSSVSEQLTL